MLEYRPGGWLRARRDSTATVFLRIRFVGEGDLTRAQVTAALMDSPGPISARSWRTAPFREAERHAMFPAVQEVLAEPAEVDGIEMLNDYFDRTADDPRYQIHLVVPSDQMTSAEGNFELVRAPDGRITDDFLENMAAMYRWAVASGRAPAPVIAESARVPVSRVHRWVAQARRRGFLPPGIKGRAG